MRTVLWIAGGLLTATGILTLLFSFAAPYGDFSTSIAQAGWDGIGDIGFTDKAKFAFFCLIVGAPTLIGLNATAWRKTGGY